MSSNKRVKIFLKKDDLLIDFMWADMSADGSVMMGLYGQPFQGNVEKIVAEKGELVSGEHFENVGSEGFIKNTKISFHASGYYKTMSKIRMSAIDRVTVKGLPLHEIKKPTRMLEILIPQNLKKTTSPYNPKKDMILDISKFPLKPLRCTISCMPLSEIDNFLKIKVVDTSIIELSDIYEDQNNAWAWTIRVSKNDIKAHERKFYYFLFGEHIPPH